LRREKANGARCANMASAAAAAARLRTTTASAGRLHLTRAGVKRGSQASCAYTFFKLVCKIKQVMFEKGIELHKGTKRPSKTVSKTVPFLSARPV